MAGGYRGGAPRPGDHGQKTGSDASRSDSTGGGGSDKPHADMGALSNVGQGNKTAAHVEAGQYSNGKPSGSSNATEPQKNLPKNVVPMNKPKPMGATPYVEGADLIGIGARVLGGIGGAATSVISQGITGTDPTQDALGDHLGKQVGWSRDPSMTPGKDRAQRGTKRDALDQAALRSAAAKNTDDNAEGPPPVYDFADVPLEDRRKPYAGLKKMLEMML